MGEDHINKTKELVSGQKKDIESVQKDLKEIKAELKNIVKGNVKVKNIA